MQTLKEKLKEDLKIAIKKSDSIKKNLIQVVLGEVAIEEGRGASGFRLNDEGVMSIIQKLKKSQEITKESYVNSSREIPDFVKKEIEILTEYLPQQLSYDQVVALISDIIEEVKPSSTKDMGIIIGKFNSEFRGQADGKIVAQIVKDKLSQMD